MAQRVFITKYMSVIDRVHNVVKLFVLKGLSTTGSLLITALLAQKFSPEILGMFVKVHVTTLFLALLVNGGLSTQFLKSYCKYSLEEKNELFSIAFLFLIKRWLVVSLAYYIVITLFYRDSLSLWCIPLSLTYSLTSSISSIYKSVKHFSLGVFSEIGGKLFLLSTVLFVIGLFTSFRLEAAFVWLFLIGLFHFFLFILQNRKVFTYPRLSRLELGEFSEFFKIGLLDWVYTNAVHLIAVSLLGNELLGYTSFYQKVGAIILFPVMVMNTYIAPKLARLDWVTKRQEVWLLLNKARRITFVGAILLTILVMQLLWLVDQWYPQYAEYKHLLVIIAIYQLLSAFAGPVYFTMSLVGLQKKLRRIMTGVTSISICLIAAGAFWFSVEGLIIGFGLQNVLRNYLGLFFLKKNLVKDDR